MSRISALVSVSPDILSGTPVFAGTRVPVDTLFAYFTNGDCLDEFLEDFPTVTRQQTIAAIELAEEHLGQHANNA